VEAPKSNDDHLGEASATMLSTAAGRRTLGLAVALVAGSLLALSLIPPGAADTQHVVLSWWSIAVIAIACELMVFHVEFRRELYSFTFSEVAMVLGLFFASPRDLVIGRLIGEALFLVLKERQPFHKMVLNMASFLAEVAVLLMVHQLFGQPLDVSGPWAWLVAFVAVGAADCIGFLVVFKAVRWHGAPITLPSILGIGALTLPVNTSFALVIGILVVDNPWAVALLGGVGTFLVLSYRSYGALRQRFESLSMLYDFTRLVSGAKRPDSVLEAILTQAKDLLRAERAEIWLIDDNGLQMRLVVDDDGRTVSALQPYQSEAMLQWCAAVDGALVVHVDGRQPLGRHIALSLAANDAIVAPITESGTVVGMVAVVNRLGEVVAFQDTDRTMFATLASHASVALENGRLIDRLHNEATERRHQALHDALTGLPNRVLFGSRLTEELTSIAHARTRVAVAVMDLDGFKEINDTLGHQFGDVVLQEVAKRVSSCVEGSAMLARLGGDEFALLFPSFGTREALEDVARRIREVVADPIHADGLRINVSVSIGFGVAPDDALDSPTLLQRADVAMYSAKAGNGNGVAFYEADRDENSPRRLTLSNDLRSAIADDQLTMVFQPKVRLSDGAMVGAEALVRWRHPSFGMIMPDEFVHLAERTGLINELTLCVLRMSLAEARRWHDSGHHWTLAVNVAMRNLLDPDFVDNVAHLLAASEVEPSRLTLEITETGVMTDTARTVDVLNGLAGLGICLSIDDFGTGYSSLSHLQQLPVSEVKIDRMFIAKMATDPNGEVIVRSMIDLAGNLNLATVAEGVEDRVTLDLLRRLGCTTAQGYYLARPMTVDGLAGWQFPDDENAVPLSPRSTLNDTLVRLS
jgi:diguanylate cyclase (GGDEF)-like protein